MNYRRRIRIPVLVLGLALLAALTGCATGSGSSSRSRGKLSDATAEAADKEEEMGRGRGRTRTKDEVYTSDNSGGGYDYYEEDSDEGGSFLVGLIASLFSGGDRDDEPEEEPPPELVDYSQSGNRTWVDNGEYGSQEDDAGEGDPVGGPDIEGSNVNFWYSRSRLAGDTVERFTNYSLMYSWYSGPRYRAHVGGYWGRGKPGSQGNLKEGLRWISETGIDIGSRGYLTPKHSLMGLYIIAGIRVGAMYWSYNTALDSLDDEGNPEQISHDGLMLFVPYIGLGTSLLQTKAVHFGVNLTIGGRLAVDKTFRDYENDLIKHVGEYKLNIEASIFF